MYKINELSEMTVCKEDPLFYMIHLSISANVDILGKKGEDILHMPALTHM
jgi:hypothetical protein